MYRVDMYYTVKTLHSRGYSKRKIAQTLGIHRNTVSRILEQVIQGELEPAIKKKEKLLDKYQEQIRTWVEEGKSAVLIHEFLSRQYGLQVAYPTVVKQIRCFKQGEVYIPLLCDPGEEAQVDFGYLGLFEYQGKKIKVWVFSMVLSHSRYSWNGIVRDQSVKTFIQCHIHAFEYFGGVPGSIKLDNLKAGVLTPDFYEPIIQHQYAEFLSHYGSTPITARIGRGQDKGKVESGIKYVKNNFLKRLTHRQYELLQGEIAHWTRQICNRRLHGTTRKVPQAVFEEVERKSLGRLPAQRYEFFEIEKRKVNSYGHIAYRYNYYSVPAGHAGKEVVIKSNGSLVKVYNGNEQIAVHALSQEQGKFITVEEHKPLHKQSKSREYYYGRMEAIGPDALSLMRELERIKPRHFHEMLRGILSLERYYERQAINLSCKRALAYQAISYREVKGILEQGLYDQPLHEALDPLGGYGHELSMYDQLIR